MAYSDTPEYRRQYYLENKAALKARRKERAQQLASENPALAERLRLRRNMLEKGRGRNRMHPVVCDGKARLGMVVEMRGKGIVKLVLGDGTVLFSSAFTFPANAKKFGAVAVGLDDLVWVTQYRKKLTKPQRQKQDAVRLTGQRKKAYAARLVTLARFCSNIERSQVAEVKRVQAAHHQYLHGQAAPMGFEMWVAAAFGTMFKKERELLMAANAQSRAE